MQGSSTAWYNQGWLLDLNTIRDAYPELGTLMDSYAEYIYPGFESHLEGAVLSDTRVCRDGRIITAAGAGVALEFALALIGALYGEEKEKQIRASVLAD